MPPFTSGKTSRLLVDIFPGNTGLFDIALNTGAN
jgi:hypothetical protein